ncbi:MAG: hypothetical protein KJ887_00460 [Candidatus Omnitrophica bacterium]|nr:hypothetical protein [Candidatus Omnitrophota bacterium]MBU1047140.1 hypothetical protein [Candidatus Omnitrophota bacterium]MBU1630419.1 hypothetical protein [Candidatus Omnitrophota bacterium]MBU1889582.1 hypothetical protein [Candidatus Omnitrophota bacterium]
MECKVVQNKKKCNCSYEPCSRKGICCECISYHPRNNELPACYFPDNVEKSYDRSIEKFIQIHSK